MNAWAPGLSMATLGGRANAHLDPRLAKALPKQRQSPRPVLVEVREARRARPLPDMAGRAGMSFGPVRWGPTIARIPPFKTARLAALGSRRRGSVPRPAGFLRRQRKRVRG